jgi:hypothetical protein
MMLSSTLITVVRELIERGLGNVYQRCEGTQKREKCVWEDSDLSGHIASTNSQH